MISKLFKNQFFLSSSIIFFGSTAANVLNYGFNLVMGRMLTPVEYGEISAIVTLAMIIVVPSATLSTLTTKSVAEHMSVENRPAISAVLHKAQKYSWIIGTVFLLTFWAAIPWLSGFFKIDYLPLIIFSFLLPVSLISAANKGGLQGLHMFKTLSVMQVLEAALKLVVAVGMVWLGYRVNGSVAALGVAALLAYGYGYIKLKPHLADLSQHQPIQFKFKVPSYVWVVFFSSLFLAVFGNIDVVLAKHYLSEFDAGQYGALAVLGRIITYGAAAVITVLLPMAAASHAVKDVNKSKKLLTYSLLATSAVSLGVLLFFVLLPELTVKFLFGSQYLPIATYLGLFGAVMLFGSLSKVFINYFLATHRYGFIVPFGLATVAQIVLIGVYNSSIKEIVSVLLLTNVFLLVAMVISYMIDKRGNNDLSSPIARSVGDEVI